MDWIITVKREYLDKILSGVKRVEFRTRVPTLLKVGDRVFCVGAQSEGRVFCYFYVDAVIKCDVNVMWDICGDYGGIYKCAFFDYFRGRNVAYAVRIAYVVRTHDGLNVGKLGLSKAPQWFARPRTMPDGL